MLGLGLTELMVILVVALIVFGPGKLPQMGKAMGKAISEFKRAVRGIDDDDDDDDKKLPPGKGDDPRLAG